MFSAYAFVLVLCVCVCALCACRMNEKTVFLTIRFDSACIISPIFL